MDRNAVDPGPLTALEEAAEAAEAQDADPASYRDLTKDEVLDRIAAGYKAALAGDHISYDELMAKLADSDQ